MAIRKSLKPYGALKTAVGRAIRAGYTRARRAVQKEKVRTAHEIGRLITQHVFLNQNRAAYGREVIHKLSKDLKISETELAYCVEFYREYKIFPHAGKLTWSQYRDLLAVNQKADRDFLIKQLIKYDWSRARLRSEIKKIKKKVKPFKVTSPGALNVYRMRKEAGENLIDLGFSTYVKKPKRAKIKIVKDRNFTFEAKVIRVVDGDTLWCLVHLGLGVKTRQKLRLRGLNAPELKSRAGQKAKRALAGYFKKSPLVLIKSTRADKYDRYLADLWAGTAYINEALIKNELAHAI